jgi:hypothetical protein
MRLTYDMFPHLIACYCFVTNQMWSKQNCHGVVGWTKNMHNMQVEKVASITEASFPICILYSQQ